MCAVYWHPGYSFYALSLYCHWSTSLCTKQAFGYQNYRTGACLTRNSVYTIQPPSPEIAKLQLGDSLPAGTDHTCDL